MKIDLVWYITYIHTDIHLDILQYHMDMIGTLS